MYTTYQEKRTGNTCIKFRKYTKENMHVDWFKMFLFHKLLDYELKISIV